MTDEEYQKEIRKFMEEDRARKMRTEQNDQVKLSDLRSRMPLGCWVFLGILGYLGYLFVQWIFKTI